MDKRLQTSIEQYRRILEHARQLDQLLSEGKPEELRSYTARLQAMQEDAGLNDRELVAEIARDAERWQARPLFHERMQLLKQIVEMNDLLLPRIRGMMSVTAAELAQLKEGRAAVSGYHQTPARPQQSVRGIG
jgi:hypothetical protein